MIRFLFVALLMVSAPSFAGNWTRSHLGTYVSAPNESVEAFVKRTAVVLENHSRATNTEACGVIGGNGTQFSLELFTDNVPQGCSMDTTALVDGYTWIGQSIHSHPWGKKIQLSRAAKAWSEHYKDGNEGTSAFFNDGAGGFSHADKHIGAGWLVAKGTLFYKTADNKVENLGSVL